MPKKEIREVNGYRVIYMPDHPAAMTSANWLGYVYEHIMVAEKALGRRLRKHEVVHHLDNNRANNRSENLLVLERSQHSKLHHWLDHGVGPPSYCGVCGLTLQVDQDKYCSKECAGEQRRIVERPSKQELKIAMAETSMAALGRKYGVSDSAVRKWAKAYGLIN